MNIILDLETSGLSPFGGRIFAIGMMDLDTKEVSIFLEKDEDYLLKQFIKALNKSKEIRIIGYNLSFDLSWLKLRMLKYGLVSFFYRDVHWVDLMDVLMSLESGENVPRRRLSDWIEYFGFEDGDKSRGFSMLSFWESNQYEKIKDHLKNDLNKTFLIYERLKTCGLV